MPVSYSNAPARYGVSICALCCQVLTPLVGESQREGVVAAFTLSCVLSPQGRGENWALHTPYLGGFSL